MLGNVIDFVKVKESREGSVDTNTTTFVHETIRVAIAKCNQLRIVMNADVVHIPPLSEDDEESIRYFCKCMDVVYDGILEDKDFMDKHGGDGKDVVKELDFLDLITNRALILFINGGFGVGK